MIKHIMSDGRILDSIAGYIVPSSDKTEAAYRIIKKACTEKGKNNLASDSVGLQKE